MVVKVEGTIQRVEGQTGECTFRRGWTQPCRSRNPNSHRRYEFSGGTSASRWHLGGQVATTGLSGDPVARTAHRDSSAAVGGVTSQHHPRRPQAEAHGRRWVRFPQQPAVDMGGVKVQAGFVHRHPGKGAFLSDRSASLPSVALPALAAPSRWARW